MNVIITGCAGFIGSHLSQFHLDRGDFVKGIDNMFSGVKENMESFYSHPHFHFEEVDICKHQDLFNTFSSADRIYHLAAIVGQQLVLSHPIEVLAINIRTTERILEAASLCEKKPKVFISSSSCVYDRLPSHIPKKEGVDLIVPSGGFRQETYPLSKLVNEVSALAYGETKQLPCVVARLFNVIGANQRGRYGMVVPTFIRQALANRPITVFGDGNQTRSFCFIDDILRSMDLIMSAPKAEGHIVNLGGREEISILSLAKLIKEKTRSSSEIIHIPYREAYHMEFEDVPRRAPILDKLDSLIGPLPQVPLEKALECMISSIRLKKTK